MERESQLQVLNSQLQQVQVQINEVQDILREVKMAMEENQRAGELLKKHGTSQNERHEGNGLNKKDLAMADEYRERAGSLEDLLFYGGSNKSIF